jgi:dsDNA-specific endonuclease/ATPase MutS2
MVNAEDLWIGERVLIISQNIQGIYQGEQSGEKIFIHTGHGRILCPLHDLKILEEDQFHPQKVVIELPSRKGADLFEKSNTIDLHIEILKPDLVGSLPERIISHQLNQFQFFLDKSIEKKVPFIKIIHGKGAGILRELVRQVLSAHPQVKLYQPSRDDGATEVWLS